MSFSDDTKIAIIGLGYVGLPIALAFAKKAKVIGFDINPKRIEALQKHIDESKDVESDEFVHTDIVFTSSPSELYAANFYIVAVPTPIDKQKNPDLGPLLSATRTVANVLKRGDYVVFESTVYPGCTEEDCVPILESISGLKHIVDFKTGFSPERINPGDKEHVFSKITKVVSGCDAVSLEKIARTYASVVEAGVFRAASIKVAEAAKIIENTQRDLNIALMNELSLIFDKMNINTYEVLEAAATKWNFLKFSPGLVGGHCIGVDPYYLTHKAKSLGYSPEVILSGRHINDSMGAYVAKKTVQLMLQKEVNVAKSKVLVLGVTFKENVKDIRNSKVVDIVEELKSFHIEVEVYDPKASSEETLHEYGFELKKSLSDNYNAIILAVPHVDFMEYDEVFFQKICNSGILVDIKGVYRGKINHLTYWSL